ncbi:MAG TPA: TetR/AcrR family transcriptional regulator [Thermoanaerobaculia bacterium]|nr:TetR/AcrR family transcriptional regulator [Thermoanaerobaculia bacterium]
MLLAAKTLFARLGYEQTSTAAIARDAGSSESQLMRYFGGKAGLLDTIFNESWAAVLARVSSEIPANASAHDSILGILGITIETFGRDHDIAVLFLFEGRRIRGTDVTLSQGFLQFYQLVQSVIRRGQGDGSFRSDLDPTVLSAAILGAAEGMIRDRLLLERRGMPNPFDDTSVRKTFQAIIDGLVGSGL